MNQTFPSRACTWLTRSAAAVVVCSLLFPVMEARAADPAFVGVLAYAVDDAAAKRLDLSDEVLEKLHKLIDERESKAIELALSIKDLPPSERRRRLSPFVAESERMGMELLTVQQRSVLGQLRLQRVGMSSLTDPAIAKMLELDSEQRQEIERLMTDRSAAMTRGGAQSRRAAQSTFERQLRAVLTKTQMATWDQMAGLGPGPQAIDAEPAAASDVDPEGAVAEKKPAELQPGDTVPADPVADPEEDEAMVSEAESGAGADASDADANSDDTQSDDGERDGSSPSDADSSAGQNREAEDDAGAPRDRDDVKLRFNFRYQPWEDVLEWLADEADLSLQSTLVPEGTFNYSDTYSYSPTEAIDLINGVLLTRGYTLVRRGRLLTVINLEDEVPDVLVEFVPVEQLDDRGEYELVKTVFRLAKMDPADAEQEIQMLLGPGRTMVVMPKAQQILVTETAGRLRMIRDVIERVENPSSGSTTAVSELNLKHVSPEEVLLIARPLLGLEADENVGDDISIASDPLGTRLFATGAKEKIQVLEDLVERVDQEKQITTNAVALEQPQLQTHAIQAADPAEALAVMQTLLAGLPDVRMSLDPQTNKIIALARPSEHRTIQETIKQLEGEAPRFEVIQLRKIDPQLAVLTIGNFFADGEGSESTIKIDADPTTMKLYVRATDTEIAQIKDLIEKLEGPGEGGPGGGNLRFIPLTGSNAQSTVETAQRLWLGANRIQLTAPSETGPTSFDLRPVHPDEETPNERTSNPRQRKSPPARTPPAATRTNATTPTTNSHPESQPAEVPRDKVTENHNTISSPMQFVALTTVAQEESDDETPPEASSSESGAEPSDEAKRVTQDPSKESDIRIEFTPNGVLIASEDTEALNQFEDLLRTVAGPQVLSTGKNFTVYFLKYCKADVARQLIQDILGGSSTDGGGGSLVGDVASNLMGGGGILGALMGGGGGSGGSGVTTVQATGPVSIVSDARLNALVVQGLPVDIQLIEQLLKVIDREGSITDIQTAGKPHIIPVIYMQADEVATLLKEAYASRMASSNQQRGGQPNPADLIRALRGGRGGGGGGSADAKSEEAKMTIAVDARSNSLIVTAPEPLYLEVKQLVEEIDQGGIDQAEEVHVVSVKNSNPEAVQRALAAIMGQSSSSNSSSNRSGASQQRSGVPGGFGGGTTSTASDIQRRMEFMRRMQGMGGGAPGGTRGTTGGRGSTRGGRGGTPGGGGRGTTGGGRGSTGGGRGGGRRGG